MGLFERVLKEVEEGMGIFVGLDEERVVVIERNEVEREIVGVEENMRGKGVVVRVEEMFVELGGRIGWGIEGGKMKWVCEEELGSGDWV